MHRVWHSSRTEVGGDEYHWYLFDSYDEEGKEQAFDSSQRNTLAIAAIFSF